jgi:peptidoglycan-associated lipoprotein
LPPPAGGGNLKTMRIALSKFPSQLLLLGLALSLIAPGCRKRPGSITPLPGQRAGLVGNEGPSGLESGKINSEPVATGGGATAEFNLEDMIQDRAALAAQTVHFDFDSSVVKASEKSRVDAVAAALKGDQAAKLLIEGHCDERGTEEYNRSLGERRALALRESLANMGVDPMRIKTLSFGEDKPVSSGHDESSWKQNRRGEFILLHPK